jgi:hypothetical protein
MNIEEKIIRSRVIKLKEKLTSLKLNYLKFDTSQEDSYVIINNVDLNIINDLFDYPAEYRIFLEEIGTVYVAYSTLFILEVSLPSKLYDSSIWVLDEEVINNENLRIIAHSDNDDILYLVYDISKVPFERYLDDFNTISLLDLVEKSINNCGFLD